MNQKLKVLEALLNIEDFKVVEMLLVVQNVFLWWTFKS